MLRQRMLGLRAFTIASLCFASTIATSAPFLASCARGVSNFDLPFEAGPKDDAVAVDADTATTTDAAGDASCGASPKLHPVPTPPTVFCPFATSTGTSTNCAAGKQCCESPQGAATPSSCVPAGSTCAVTGAIPLECDGPTNCASGNVCCAIAAAVDTKPGCTYESAVAFLGTKCKKACAASEFVVCEANAECSAGLTCTPFKAVGAQYGHCK